MILDTALQVEIELGALRPIVEAAIAAAGIALVQYGRKVARRREPFKPSKFAATVLVGAGLGVFFTLSGRSLTEDSIMGGLATYAGLVVAVENIIRGVIDESQGVAFMPTDPDAKGDAQT